MLFKVRKFVNKHFPDETHKSAFRFSFILYMTSCVSITLCAKTTGLWLMYRNYSLASIAFFTSIMHMPYSSLRFFMAAWLDYIPIPNIRNLGYRRSFMLITILYCSLSLVGLSFVTPGNIHLFALIAFSCSISSAILESLISAYFNNVYDEKYNPSWIQAGQLGYQVGLYVMHTLVITISIYVSWRTIFLVSAIMVALSSLIIPKTPPCCFTKQSRPKSMHELYTIPIKSFYTNHKKYFSRLSIFLLFYRIPDQLIGPLLTYIQIDIFGKILTTVIKSLALLGVLVGSFIWKSIGTNQENRLIKIGVIHSIAIAAIGILIYTQQNNPENILILALLSGSFLIMKALRTMESAAIFNYQCSLYDKQYYNAQASLGTLTDKILGSITSAPAGVLVTIIGWPAFFILAACTSIPSLMSMRGIIKKTIS